MLLWNKSGIFWNTGLPVDVKTVRIGNITFEKGVCHCARKAHGITESTAKTPISVHYLKDLQLLILM